MIALEVYSDAIFYFRADISKKIAAIFLVFVKLHNRDVSYLAYNKIKNDKQAYDFLNILGSKQLISWKKFYSFFEQ